MSLPTTPAHKKRLRVSGKQNDRVVGPGGTPRPTIAGVHSWARAGPVQTTKKRNGPNSNPDETKNYTCTEKAGRGLWQHTRAANDVHVAEIIHDTAVQSGDFHCSKRKKEKKQQERCAAGRNTEYLRITRKGAATKKASPATEENKRYTHAQPTAARYRCRAAAPAAQKRRWQLQPDWRQPPMKKTHKKKEK